MKHAPLLACLMVLTSAGSLLALDDAVKIKTDDTAAEVPRLIVTSSAAVGSRAVVKVQEAVLQIKAAATPGEPPGHSTAA